MSEKREKPSDEPHPAPASSPKDAREARLAAALRTNLRRRKSAARDSEG
jgi:hypothetical protein